MNSSHYSGKAICKEAANNGVCWRHGLSVVTWKRKSLRMALEPIRTNTPETSNATRWRYQSFLIDVFARLIIEWCFFFGHLPYWVAWNPNNRLYVTKWPVYHGQSPVTTSQHTTGESSQQLHSFYHLHEKKYMERKVCLACPSGPCGPRRRSSAALLLGSRVRISLRVYWFWSVVFVVCYVHSGFWDELIIPSHVSYQLYARECLIVCHPEISTVRRPGNGLGCCAKETKKNIFEDAWFVTLWRN